MLIDPLCKGIVFGGSPTSFKLAAIFAGTVQFEIECILEIRKLRRADCVFRQNRRNENNPIALCEDEVARQYDGPADADGCVDRGQGHISPCGWVIAAVDAV